MINTYFSGGKVTKQICHFLSYLKNFRKKFFFRIRQAEK